MVAERGRFELPNGSSPSTVFKTVAFNRSATPPQGPEVYHRDAPASEGIAGDHPCPASPSDARSKRATDSTCEVCGNMLAMPAAARR